MTTRNVLKGTQHEREASDDLSGRDLDAAIAEHVLGWKLCPVGPDYDGENACEVLTPDGVLPEGYALPNRGYLHRGLFAPLFHSDLSEAIRLSQRFGWKTLAIEADLRDLPTLIARAVLAEVLEKRQKANQSR